MWSYGPSAGFGRLSPDSPPAPSAPREPSDFAALFALVPFQNLPKAR